MKQGYSIRKQKSDTKIIHAVMLTGTRPCAVFGCKNCCGPIAVAILQSEGTNRQLDWRAEQISQLVRSFAGHRSAGFVNCCLRSVFVVVVVVVLVLFCLSGMNQRPSLSVSRISYTPESLNLYIDAESSNINEPVPNKESMLWPPERGHKTEAHEL